MLCSISTWVDGTGPIPFIVLILSIFPSIQSIKCIRKAGNVTLPSYDCEGDVCLIRRESSTSPMYMDCGEGSYYNHYANGCYGRSAMLCVCRSDSCNTESFVSSNPSNANRHTITCNGTATNVTSSIGKCSGYYCLSHSIATTTVVPYMYYCLADPPSMLPFAPFMGLCYRFEYGMSGSVTKSTGTICVCDTDYCSSGVGLLPAAPETIVVGTNKTVVGVECFTDENRTVSCRGDVCFLFRNTLTNVIERGCLIHQRTSEARSLLYPGHTRDVFIEYYVCNSDQCNRNIASAQASIAAMPTTTVGLTDTTDDGSTPDVWWTTPAGWTGIIDLNDTQWNDSFFENETDGNSTNSTGGKDKHAHSYHLIISFLVVLAATLLLG